MYTGLKKYIRYLHSLQIQTNFNHRHLYVLSYFVCDYVARTFIFCPLLSYSIADLRVDLVKDYFKQNSLVI